MTWSARISASLLSARSFAAFARRRIHVEYQIFVSPSRRSSRSLSFQCSSSGQSIRKKKLFDSRAAAITRNFAPVYETRNGKLVDIFVKIRPCYMVERVREENLHKAFSRCCCVPKRREPFERKKKARTNAGDL